MNYEHLESVFPNRLRRLREARRLSQRALGELVGVATQTVERWEAGRREPGIFDAMRVCAAMELSWAVWIVDDEQFDEWVRWVGDDTRQEAEEIH